MAALTVQRGSGAGFAGSRRSWLRAWAGGLGALALIAATPSSAQTQQATIERVRPSILAIGTFQQTRVPQFSFRGTGFVVGDGTLAATNAHVIPTSLEPGGDPEQLVAVLPGADGSRIALRKLTPVALDPDHDLALLKMDGTPLKPLVLRDPTGIVEGDMLLFTGYPIGGALGLFPATHRAMIAAIAPIAIPSASSQRLDAKSIRRLRDSAFPIFQLDATAFPGNSGSPLYEPATGEVVGILNMVFVKGTKEAALSQPSGISYAVPSRYLMELVARSSPR